MNSFKYIIVSILWILITVSACSEKVTIPEDLYETEPSVEQVEGLIVIAQRVQTKWIVSADQLIRWEADGSPLTSLPRSVKNTLKYLVTLSGHSAVRYAGQVACAAGLEYGSSQKELSSCLVFGTAMRSDSIGLLFDVRAAAEFDYVRFTPTDSSFPSTHLESFVLQTESNIQSSQSVAALGDVTRIGMIYTQLDSLTEIHFALADPVKYTSSQLSDILPFGGNTVQNLQIQNVLRSRTDSSIVVHCTAQLQGAFYSFLLESTSTSWSCIAITPLRQRFIAKTIFSNE